MKRVFDVGLTIPVARMLQRMKRSFPQTIVDDVILEVADRTLLSEDQVEGLLPEAATFMQDVLDFDFRLTVPLQTKLFWSAHANAHLWLEPILRAAALEGVTDIVITRGKHSYSRCAAMIEKAGMRFHSVQSAFALEEGSIVPRDAVLINFADNISLNGAMSPLTLEFPRSIVFADRMAAHGMKLFPTGMSLQAGLANVETLGAKSSIELSFLFSTSQALSRVIV